MDGQALYASVVRSEVTVFAFDSKRYRSTEFTDVLASGVALPTSVASSDPVEDITDENKEVLSDDDGYSARRRSGMAERVRALGIRPAWWKEKKKERIRRDMRLNRSRIRSSKVAARPSFESLHVPREIAYYIFEHIDDLETLISLLLVNKTFAGCFEAKCILITGAVLWNMFGPGLVDRVLMLAVLLNRDESYKDEDGRIYLTSPDQSMALSSSVMGSINTIYHTLNVCFELWWRERDWIYERYRRHEIMKKAGLTAAVGARVKRGFLNLWIYAQCAQNSLENRPYANYEHDSITLEDANVLGNFSHFELLEVHAIFRFFEGVLQQLCVEINVDHEDDGLYRWQYYFISLGPVWFLRLLDRYELALGIPRRDGGDQGFSIYDLNREVEDRGIDVGELDVLLDYDHRKLAHRLERKNMDGEARPTPEERQRWLDAEG